MCSFFTNYSQLTIVFVFVLLSSGGLCTTETGTDDAHQELLSQVENATLRTEMAAESYNKTGRIITFDSLMKFTETFGNILLNSNDGTKTSGTSSSTGSGAGGGGGNKKKKKTEKPKPDKNKESERPINENETTPNESTNFNNVLYALGANMFGGGGSGANNVTKLLGPLVNQILTGVGGGNKQPAPQSTTVANKKKPDKKKDTILEIGLDGIKVSPNISLFNFTSVFVNETLKCQTPTKETGVCLRMSYCPTLLLNLNNFRNSICFADTFTPGVCCPKSLIISNFTKPHTTRKPPSLLPSSSLSHFANKNDSLVAQATPATIQNVPHQVQQSHYKPKHEVINVNDCGIQSVNSFRIVGGEDSYEHQWPWVVAIYFVDLQRVPKKHCGGTIIHPKFILTAAHCTENRRGTKFPVSRVLVRVSATDLDNEQAGHWYKVAKIITNEHFVRTNFLNDIALIKLIKPIEKRTKAVPICLPRADLSDGFIYQKKSTILGWGNTEYNGEASSRLKYAEVPIWSNDECYENTRYTDLSENQFCAGYYQGGIDACQGDSGGPLILYYGDRWTQIGIISYGIECAKAYKPGIYTKVSRYRYWIEQMIQDNL